MKRIRILLLIAVAASLIGKGLFSAEKKVDEALYLNEVAPDADFGEKKGFYYPSIKGVVAFNSYDVTPSIKGYAGPIKLLIALAPEGFDRADSPGVKIAGLKILEHKETPNYVRGMESREFLGQFIGRSISDPIEIDQDIDGISRATVSVKALAETVRESGREAAYKAMGLEVVERTADKKFSSMWIIYLSLFFAALAAYFVTRRARGFLRSRDGILLLSIPLIGVYLSAPFSILHVFNVLLMRFSSDMLWYSVVVSAALSIALAGRFYCGWLCPFGALAEFIGRLPARKWKVQVETDDRWRRLKYVILLVLIPLVILSGEPGLGNFETYVTLFSFHGTYFAWGLVALGLAANLRVERFWCRYLCPVAALAGALSRKDSGYVSRHDCPMANKPNPLISECIRCNRCYARERKGKLEGMKAMAGHMEFTAEAEELRHRDRRLG